MLQGINMFKVDMITKDTRRPISFQGDNHVSQPTGTQADRSCSPALWEASLCVKALLTRVQNVAGLGNGAEQGR